MIDQNIKVMINEYLDGELDAENEALIMLKIKEDKKIEKYFEEIKAVKVKVESLKEATRFYIFKERWRIKLGEVYNSKLARKRTYRVLGAVAACAVILVFGFRFINQGTRDNSMDEALFMAKSEVAEMEQSPEVMEAAPMQQQASLADDEVDYVAEERAGEPEGMMLEEAESQVVMLELYEENIEETLLIIQIITLGQPEQPIVEENAISIYIDRHNKDELFKYLYEKGFVEDISEIEEKTLVLIFK